MKRQGSLVLRRLSGSPNAAIPLMGGRVVVGRGSMCDIVLPDSSVSRRHAELSLEKTTVTVRDLGSRNGTFVDEERVTICEVFPGQHLRFGGLAFVINEPGVDAHAAGADQETQSVREALRQNSKLKNLSGAERRVLDLLLTGLSEKEMSGRLKISRHTVHNHVREIYRIFGVHSRAEMIAQFVPAPHSGQAVVP